MSKEKEREYILEDLLKSAERLIEDIKEKEVTPALTPESEKKLEKDLPEEIYIQELKELETEKSEVIHGYAEIYISDDIMEVTVDFHPPAENGMPIEFDDVKYLLDSHGVMYGVHKDTIQEAIDQCNNQRIHVTGVVIARGTEPEDEVPEHIIIETHLLKKPIKIDEKSYSVDFKELTSYILVKKSETLARIIPLKEGKFGKTVKGKYIPYRKKVVEKIQAGKNTVVKGDRIVAACDGRFDFKKKLFWVSEVFEVLGDVDFKTGNITFPGDIIIHGRVNDGFRVESGGSIFCRKTLDASKVVCSGDLVIDRGIVGRKKGRVEVGGIVSAKFIENCWVDAKDSIFVEAGILHSIIHSHNRVEMGKEGIIVGGKIFTQNGVIAGQIGTKMEIKTEILCGIDYEAQRKIEWIKEKTVELATKLTKVNERINKKEKGYERLLPLKQKITESMHALNENAKSLMLHLDKNEDAEVVVYGSVYYGVYVEICHVSYIVPREFMHVRFWLDKERGKVQVGPI